MNLPYVYGIFSGFARGFSSLQQVFLLLATCAILFLAACSAPSGSTADNTASSNNTSTPPTLAIQNTSPAPTSESAVFTDTFIATHTPVAQAVDQINQINQKMDATEPVTVPEASLSQPEGDAVLLPAPLYFLSHGQIVRLERDGITRSQITNESGYVDGFDSAPASGALSYTVQPEDPEALRFIAYSNAFGEQRVELFTAAVRSPVFVEDDEMLRELDPQSNGHNVAYRVFERVPHVEEARANPGVFQSTDVAMCPFVRQPDDPAPTPDTPPDGARSFEPIAISPDSTKLLMRVAIAPSASAIVVQQPNSTLVELTQRDGTLLPHWHASWNRDGTAIYAATPPSVAATETGMPSGLWRADATSGLANLILPSVLPTQDSLVRIVAYPRQLSDGAVYIFLAKAAMEMALTADATMLPYTMYRIAPDGSGTPEALRSDSYVLRHVLWADDASGAVVEATMPDESVVLLWLPADGSAAVQLADGELGSDMHWGTGER